MRMRERTRVRARGGVGIRMQERGCRIRTRPCTARISDRSGGNLAHLGHAGGRASTHPHTFRRGHVCGCVGVGVCVRALYYFSLRAHMTIGLSTRAHAHRHLSFPPASTPLPRHLNPPSTSPAAASEAIAALAVMRVSSPLPLVSAPRPRAPLQGPRRLVNAFSSIGVL